MPQQILYSVTIMLFILLKLCWRFDNPHLREDTGVVSPHAPCQDMEDGRRQNLMAKV